MWSKFSIVNQGCRLNAAESQVLIEKLQRKGFKLSDINDSSLVIINTCAVTHRAESDFRKIVRRIRRENPEAKIIAAGCLVDLNPEEASLADIYLKNSEKMNIPEMFSGSNGEQNKRWRARGFLKVQEGCDLACTYCIIPKLRGKSRSVSLMSIGQRMEEFLNLGYEEVIVTGIHLESYGLDLGMKDGFKKLLFYLEKFHPQVRFRISSLDPRFLSKELLDYILKSKHIMPSFHLSFQHYSNKVLGRMGRGNNKVFKEIMEEIRSRKEIAGIGADFLVGFPGEEDEDFKILLDFVKSSPFTYLHVFSFSPRPGTKAVNMRPKVPERVSKERSAILREIAKGKKKLFLETLVGKEIEGTVIREGEALLENYIKLKYKNNNLKTSKRYTFQITAFYEGILYGKPINFS